MDASYIEFVLPCQKRALHQLSPFHPPAAPPPPFCCLSDFPILTQDHLPPATQARQSPGPLFSLPSPIFDSRPHPVDLSSSVFPKSTSGFPSHRFGLGPHPLRFSQPITLLHSPPLVHPFCTFFFFLTKCMYKHIPLLLLKLMAAYLTLR